MIIKWEGIGDALIGIFLALDSFIYSLVSSAYRIFMSLASARILSSSAYEDIARKIYIVIGVLMLFVLAYAIIKGIIDPDKITKGEMSGPKILKSVLVTVVGLAITPVVFNILYQAQGLFLEKDVIANIFFRSADETYSLGNITVEGISEDSESTSDVTVNVGDVAYNKEIKRIGGAVTALETFKPFFRPYSNSCDEVDFCKSGKTVAESIVANPRDYYTSASVGWGLGCAAGVALAVTGFLASWFTFGTSLVIAGAGVGMCVASATNAVEAYNWRDTSEVNLAQAYAYVAESGDFSIFRIFTDNVQSGEINYMFLVSTVFGIFICYVFVSFCIDLGVRAGKLAYYQIIAPIPLILQILPKFKDSFKKYINSVISTFLEVFIRISVVYLITYLICHIDEMFTNVFNVGSGLEWYEGAIAVALLIVGLILFAKSAPKLISDTFGIQGGALSFGIGKKLAEGEVFTAGALVGSAVTSGVRNLTNRWGNKENWKNADGERTLGSVTRNIGRGLASGAAGVGSAAARSVYGRATSHKPVANNRDMRDIARRTANEVTDARDRRDNWNSEKASETVTDAAGNTVKKYSGAADRFVRGHLSDVGLGISRWATGSIDTSVEDKFLDFMGGEVDTRDNLRTKTGKIAYARLAQQFVEDLNKVQIKEYDETAYEAALQSAMSSVDRNDSRYDRDAAGNLTATGIRQYQDDLENARKSVNKEAFRNLRYADEAARQEIRKNIANKYNETMQDFAIMELLQKNGGAEQAALQNYIINKWSDIRNRFSEELIDEKGNKITLGAALANIGMDLSTGKIDFSKMKDGNNRIVLTHKNGSKTYANVKLSSSGGIESIDGKSVNSFYSSIGDDVVNIGADTALNALTDLLKDNKNRIANDPERIKRKQRQREQSNNNSHK